MTHFMSTLSRRWKPLRTMVAWKAFPGWDAAALPCCRRRWAAGWPACGLRSGTRYASPTWKRYLMSTENIGPRQRKPATEGHAQALQPRGQSLAADPPYRARSLAVHRVVLQHGAGPRAWPHQRLGGHLLPHGHRAGGPAHGRHREARRAGRSTGYSRSRIRMSRLLCCVAPAGGVRRRSHPKPAFAAVARMLDVAQYGVLVASERMPVARRLVLP